MKDAVIVLSGGMDSVTLLYERAAEIALAVTFVTRDGYRT